MPAAKKLGMRRGTVSGSDGTQVDFQVEGQGPALVLTNGLTTTSTFWKYLKPRWLTRHTLVTWDLPGHGSSDPARTPYSATIEAQPDLLVRVMDAAGVERATQVGFSMGCQVVLETVRQHPARCQAVVLLLGSAGHVLSTTRLPLPGPLLLRLLRDTPDHAFAPLLRGFSRLANRPLSVNAGRLLGLLGRGASDRDLLEITEHMLVIDPPTIRRMAASAEEHTAFDLLPTLDLPLLVVAGDRDPFAPTELVGIPVHRATPGSELVRLPDGTHTALLDEPEKIGAIVDDFLSRRVSASALA
jgi:pimeloyl-ACP methyl ester carboxylesterase